MRFLPDSVLDYAVKVVWNGNDDIVFISDFEKSKKRYINRCSALVDKLLKENDAVVIFKEYIAFYKDMLCGLCNYDGKIILPREFKELMVLDDDDKPEYVETIKEGNANVYSLSEMKFILPDGEYDEACAYKFGISVSKNDLFGIFNFQGEVIIPCEYDEVWEGHTVFHHFITKKDGWFQILDEKGKLATNEKFSTFSETAKMIYRIKR